jgi:hypothetical protein
MLYCVGCVTFGIILFVDFVHRVLSRTRHNGQGARNDTDILLYSTSMGLCNIRLLFALYTVCGVVRICSHIY